MVVVVVVVGVAAAAAVVVVVVVVAVVVVVVAATVGVVVVVGVVIAVVVDVLGLPVAAAVAAAAAAAAAVAAEVAALAAASAGAVRNTRSTVPPAGTSETVQVFEYVCREHEVFHAIQHKTLDKCAEGRATLCTSTASVPKHKGCNCMTDWWLPNYAILEPRTYATPSKQNAQCQ